MTCAKSEDTYQPAYPGSLIITYAFFRHDVWNLICRWLTCVPFMHRDITFAGKLHPKHMTFFPLRVAPNQVNISIPLEKWIQAAQICIHCSHLCLLRFPCSWLKQIILEPVKTQLSTFNLTQSLAFYLVYQRKSTAINKADFKITLHQSWYWL